MALSATILLPLLWMKGLPERAKARDQCFDGCAVIAAGRVDDAIRRPGFGLQQRRVVERTDYRIDAVDRNRVGFGLVANEAANRVPVRDQSRGDRAADETVGACEEDTHVLCPIVVAAPNRLAIDQAEGRRTSPGYHTLYFNRSELATFTEASETAERHRTAAERLNDLEKRNRTEGEALDDFSIGRISSFLKSYGEMRKGEQFVMDEVRARARERVRWGASLGLLALALLFAPIAWRRPRLRAPQ